MKYIKLFEQFIKEDAMSPSEESDVVIDDIKLEDGRVISSAEAVGAILNTESEKELEEFFYGKYGENAFKAGEMATLKKFWQEHSTEKKELEAEAEREAEAEAEGSEEEDPLAGL